MSKRVGLNRLGIKRRRTYVREWREAHNLTQTELGDLCGASYATISRLEKGEAAITLQLLEAIAKVFKTDAITLQIRGPNDDDDIAPLWARADAKERKQILSIARTIVDES